MVTDENNLAEIFTEPLQGKKRAFEERKNSQVRQEKERSLDELVKKTLNGNLEGNNVHEIRNKQNEQGHLKVSYDLDKIEENVKKEDNIYVLNDEVSLNGLYQQIDLINKDILTGLDLNKYEEEKSIDMSDVYRTKSILQTKQDRVYTNEYKKEDEEIENIPALFNALKNAQFNSVKLRSKIYQFIHNELYKIESRYQTEIETMKRDHKSQVNEMIIKQAEERERLKSEMSGVEKKAETRLRKLKQNQVNFVKMVAVKVEERIEEWKRQFTK